MSIEIASEELDESLYDNIYVVVILDSFIFAMQDSQPFEFVENGFVHRIDYDNVL